jgi:hypothetical protein
MQLRINDWARARVASGGAPVTHADRQGRQHGDGARRGLAARLAAGAVQDQARDRRQLQAHARGDEAREPRRRAFRGRLAQPVRTVASASCSRRSRRRIACSSRCSKAWPTTSGARCSNLPQYAAVRPGLHEEGLRQRHRLPGPPAGREHRARTISCATPSRSEVDSPDWQRLEQQFVESSSDPEVSDAPRRTQDRRRPAPPPPDGMPWQELPQRTGHRFFASPQQRWAEQIVADLENPLRRPAATQSVVVAGREDPSRARPRVPRSVAPGRRGGRYRQATTARTSRAPWLRQATIRRLAGAEPRRAGDDPRARRPRAAQGPGRPDGRGAGRRRQDVPGIRSRGLRSRRLRRILYAPRLLPPAGGRQASGKGVVVVVPPWNFPIAIPAAACRAPWPPATP